jgi:hypothetical protein
MKQGGDSSITLELPELIKLNRLVRGGIDLAAFVSWYDAIPVDEQSALLYHLHLFAQQAGCDQQTWQRAIYEVGQTEDDPLVRAVALFRGGYSPELGFEQDWLRRLDPSERRRLLPLFVYLFGYAEARVLAHETVESCNHWWHRDLLDDRVVQELLADPEFWRTSMKSDASHSGILG